MCSKKDYIAIAAFIRHKVDNKPNADVSPLTVRRHDMQDIANSLARYFAEDNAKFDRAKFIRACGVTELL